MNVFQEDLEKEVVLEVSHRRTRTHKTRQPHRHPHKL